MKKILSALIIIASCSIASGQTDSVIVADTVSTADTTSVRDSVLMENSVNYPTISVAAGDNNEELGSQDISGILQSSRDIFTSTAGYNFGSARYRVRGYESENTAVLINGINMNDPERGYASWSTWGGLNDVTRYRELQTGISASDVTFGGVGGYSNISTRASTFRKGQRFSYSLSNRSYSHRFMYTYATGMMENGWAVGASASRRWAEEGYVEGTFMDAWSYFLAIEKKLSDDQSLNFTAFGAPNKQGKQGVAIQEAYDLAGTNFYNPYWGYQNGMKRNSRVSNVHKPMGILTHNIKLDEKCKIATSLFLSKGRSGNTSINWDDAKDPRPDYYKNYPSYYEQSSTENFAGLTDSWITDVNTRQIDWDAFYFANSKNLYTVENVNGQQGNNITGNRSKYIVEEQRNDQTFYGITSSGKYNMSEKLNFSGGLNATIYSDHYFTVMNDLLGGDFWLDIDKFAEGSALDTNAAQNDLSNPNKIVKVGDKFGYDYLINVNRYEGFAQTQYNLKRFALYLGSTVSFTSFWREGNLQNGKFPDNSLGNSAKNNFTNYGVKTGVTYTISGRQYISLNGAYLTRAPLPNVVFVSPKTRNEQLADVKSEKILSSDINYMVRFPKFKMRTTLFYSEFKDQIWFRSFYHDTYKTFGNYFLTGVDNLHYGLEFGAEANVTSSILLTAVVAKGEFLYNSRPTNLLTRDNSAEVLAKDEVIYIKNYRVGGKPQSAASLGVKYSFKYAFIGVNANYFDDIYVDVNPDRRTERATQFLVPSDPQYTELLEQEKLPANYTVDLFAGKSFRIKGYFLNINLNVTNVLNNKTFITGGFEQLRYNPHDIDKFPSKYYYYYGTTFFLNLGFRF